MLEHLNRPLRRPTRVVILGAAGFVGKAARTAFDGEGTPVLALGRQEIDLLAQGAGDRLSESIEPDDTVLIIAAEAPCKNTSMLVSNIKMMEAVSGALERSSPAHVMYVSSDAVYRDSMELLDESSCAEPSSLHGIMHLTREVMLKDAVDCPLAILRPTLIYGAEDPHNGYGPNKFRRLAEQGEDIVLFGEGEERRDHVHVNDVAELIRLIAWHRSQGVLNAVTGHVISFRKIAEMIADLSEPSVTVKGTPRTGPMPHNGFRAFNNQATQEAFPDFRYLELAEGLAKIQNEALG